MSSGSPQTVHRRGGGVGGGGSGTKPTKASRSPKDSPEQHTPIVGRLSEYLPIVVFATFIKLLLVPSYRSTDFEVHRNWLAITHSLPIHRWYYEDTSEWTLDYPPFFAWFEHLLSRMAALVHPEMLEVKNLGYASWQTVLFQRLSVIVTEGVLVYGAARIASRLHTKTQRQILFGIIFLSPGLLFVDHVHFQYNGFMYGLQLLSIAAMLEDRPLLGGILFAVILNFKHIYLYQAPAYFVYLFRVYCFKNGTFSLTRFTTLGLSVLTVFAASFSPFIHHLPQILSRLFPFKRGLCHAYWAPNFWALYAGADRVLVLAAKLFRHPRPPSLASPTRGLIGDTTFTLLPAITPLHTLLLTIATQLPVLYALWKRPKKDVFVDAVVMCGFGAYLFGWHVHEKAILIVLVPLSLTVTRSPAQARIFYILACTGYFSLHPLLFKAAETPLKLLTTLAFATIAPPFLSAISSGKSLGLYIHEKAYLALFIPLFVYTDVVQPFWTWRQELRGGGGEGGGDGDGLGEGGGKWTFLPLLVTSVYCAVGVVYCWGVLGWRVVRGM
ncbi:glycosyl transferase [Fimicolochytrium jonesii]|uniref:glycosyl transferase n=1 Tax=Fimicolochytrium jonesii TaxID=1396493 RepID=UPI0022FE1DD6|nr:glycosyl transferase [Fimicolochytrium jonesii]KAI8816632.1 glycosyl transferase [Fimicolochytrium jonesii]